MIVDLGLGNVASVKNMFQYLGIEAEIRTNPTSLSELDRYVLPGVGSFDEGVKRLHKNGWFEHLLTLPTDTHILGICLGMQLLGTSSDEGKEIGLNRVPAHFERFKTPEIRVPHIGWNVINQKQNDLLISFDSKPRFYFTHSYRAVCQDQEMTIATTLHGEEFTSVFRNGNTRGVQFHPEKSHRYGMSLLKNWAALEC